MSRTVEQRFWAKVDRAEGCWTWTAARHEWGYGLFGVDGRPRRAHRIAWELEHGPVPGGLWVLHRCDNPPCVRPDHLFLGTAADNTADMHAKGRNANNVPAMRLALAANPAALSLPGEQNPRARLTAEQVADIRHRYATERRYGLVKQLCADFDVNRTQIHRIVTNRAWKEAA